MTAAGQKRKYERVTNLILPQQLSVTACIFLSKCSEITEHERVRDDMVLCPHSVRMVPICWRRPDFDPGCRFRLTHARPPQFNVVQWFAKHSGGSANSGTLGQRRIGGNT